jgi:hypothetical protein
VEAAVWTTEDPEEGEEEETIGTLIVSIII